MNEDLPAGFRDRNDVEVLFRDTIGNNECLVFSVYTSHIELQMRSRTGRWTSVQSFSHGARDGRVIDKSSNFKAPAVAMEVFLRACLEAL